MRLRSLKHIVEAVNSLLHPRRITVLGSSALLAQEPDLGERGHALETTLDADLLVEPCDERKAAVAHEAVGEGSLFQKEYGVYADFMRPEILKTLPDGWESRCLLLEGDKSVRCLHPLDVAVVKLMLGRDKDVSLLKSLVKAGVIGLDPLRKAYERTEMNEREMFRAGRILRQLELGCGGEHAASTGVPPSVRESRAGYRIRRRRRGPSGRIPKGRVFG